MIYGAYGYSGRLIEGLAQGTIGRRDRELVNIPLVVKDIDYGNGDVSLLGGCVNGILHDGYSRHYCLLARI